MPLNHSGLAPAALILSVTIVMATIAIHADSNKPTTTGATPPTEPNAVSDKPATQPDTQDDDLTFEQICDRVTPIIRMYCPDATITRDANNFKAFHNTMDFHVHGTDMMGEYQPKPFVIQGPKAGGGFVLTLDRQKGTGPIQARTPSRIDYHYFILYFDFPVIESNTHTLTVHLSYNKKSDTRLLAELISAIPVHKRARAKTGQSQTTQPAQSQPGAPRPKSAD